MNHRPERVESLIEHELANIISREIELEAGAIATVTGVAVDKKLEHAHIKISVLPSSGEEKALQVFKKAQGTLQYLLTKKLNIKPMPRIEFKLDHGAEAAARIEKLLIESENKDVGIPT